MSQHAAIRGLLFDKDGTILDYWQTWIPINRELALYAAGDSLVLRDELLRAGGHDPATDRVIAGSVWAAAGLSGIVDMLREHLGARAPADLYAAGERMFREGGASNSVMIDGAAAALTDLARQGFRLGIATNDTAAGIDASLGRHGVLNLFAFKAGCDSGHGVKPDPGMVLAFAAALGMPPCEIAVIGDSIHDLETAHRAGAGLAIAVLSGTSGRADLAPHADAVIDSVADLSRFLQMHTQRPTLR